VFALLVLLRLAWLGSRLQVTQENSGEMSEIVVAACNHWGTPFGVPKKKIAYEEKENPETFFCQT